MGPAPESELSSAEFLADVEVAVTDRFADPRVPGPRGGLRSRDGRRVTGEAQNMTGRARAAPLSAAAFRHLVPDAARELADAGVGAVFASTVGAPRSPGPTWINVSSRWGYGRLIRRADGSFDSSAYRIPDGTQLRNEHGDIVRREDLDELIAAVAQREKQPDWSYRPSVTGESSRPG